MYRTIDSAFWTDPKTRALSPSARLLFLYLVTNPHSHVGGIYYLPFVLIAPETGLSRRAAGAAMTVLEDAELVSYDRPAEVIWVRNMMRYQGRGEKNERSVARHLEGLRSPCIVAKYLDAYPNVKSLVNTHYLHTLSDTLSDRGSEVGTPSRSRNRIRKPPNPLSGDGGGISFPTKTGTGIVNADQVAKWQKRHPSLDVEFCLRDAGAYLEDHPDRRPQRIVAFLGNWLRREEKTQRINTAPHLADVKHEPPTQRPKVCPLCKGEGKMLYGDGKWKTCKVCLGDWDGRSRSTPNASSATASAPTANGKG